jgi:hypothetical protein
MHLVFKLCLLRATLLLNMLCQRSVWMQRFTALLVCDFPRLTTDGVLAVLHDNTLRIGLLISSLFTSCTPACRR